MGRAPADRPVPIFFRELYTAIFSSLKGREEKDFRSYPSRKGSVGWRKSKPRSQIAGLVDERRKRVHRKSLLEFIELGLNYVFPQAPGSMVTGVPTAHSHPFHATQFRSEINHV